MINQIYLDDIKNVKSRGSAKFVTLVLTLWQVDNLDAPLPMPNVLFIDR